jgi:hypothetical protein
MRRSRVSDFLADITQQAHSLFARGVTRFHDSLAPLDARIARERSRGVLCAGGFVGCMQKV